MGGAGQQPAGGQQAACGGGFMGPSPWRHGAGSKHRHTRAHTRTRTPACTEMWWRGNYEGTATVPTALWQGQLAAALLSLPLKPAPGRKRPASEGEAPGGCRDHRGHALGPPAPADPPPTRAVALGTPPAGSKPAQPSAQSSPYPFGQSLSAPHTLTSCTPGRPTASSWHDSLT